MAHAAPGWQSPFDLSGPGTVASAVARTAQAPAQPPTWSDEFDGTSLDPTRWNYRATGPRNDGILTPSAVSVGGGSLTIKTYTEAGQHYSGMISTQKFGSMGFEQTYGYFEARMKFNSLPGQWSAFWLQTPTNGSPLNEPAAAGVEMDIAEYRARCVTAPSPTPPATCAADNDISNRIQQALIWDGYGADSKAAVKLSDPLAMLGDSNWHTWALRWTPTSVTFYYDDAATWSVTSPISRRSQHIILSSEVGRFFAGAIPAAGYGSRETSTTNMQVDYVRVWAMAPVNTAAPTMSGTPAVGQALACSTGSWSGDPAPTLSYAWLSDGSPIGGASASPAYTVQSADQGHALSCRVRGTNTAGSASALSNALLIPAPPPPPAPPSPRQALPPPPSPPPPVDGTAPNARLFGSTSQPVGATVTVTISCPDEACRATTTGSVRVPKLGRARARTYTPKAITREIPRGRKVSVKLKLAGGARAAVTRALRARKRSVAKLVVRVADRTGNSRTLSRHVALKLRRPSRTARR
jgi:beta-glucanase (GH16 family)